MSLENNDTASQKRKGVKHLLQCHCVLTKYRQMSDPIFHQFMAFSVIDLESDTVVPKFAECNNCGAVHKVIDFCKSEIIAGKEDMSTQLSIDDIRHSIPESVFEILESYNKEIPDYEHAQFILENGLWEDYIVLTREEIDDYVQGKLVRFVSNEKFRVESYTLRRTI